MLCVSLKEGNSFEECRTCASRYPLIELRLDSLMLSDGEMSALCALPAAVVATCRKTDSEDLQIQQLSRALRAGASYVDIELEASDAQVERIRRITADKGASLIISYHNFESTPSRAELEALIESSTARGADIVKIACEVRSDADGARLLGLLERQERLVIVGMGAGGRFLRVVAPLLGSLWTYAAPVAGKETAAGQLTANDCERLMRELADL